MNSIFEPRNNNAYIRHKTYITQVVSNDHSQQWRIQISNESLTCNNNNLQSVHLPHPLHIINKGQNCMLTKHSPPLTQAFHHYIFSHPEYHESDMIVGILKINITECIKKNFMKSWSHTANTSSPLTRTLLPLSAVATGHPVSPTLILCLSLRHIRRQYSRTIRAYSLIKRKVAAA